MAESEINFRDKAQKRKKKHRLILPIIVFYSVTLSVASFMFGRATGANEYYGKLIDTRVISSATDVKLSLYTINASVSLPDGAPYRNGTVELDSAASEKTDNTGIFKLENVKSGSHKISVIQNDVVLASCNITLYGVSDILEAVCAKKSDGSFLIETPSSAVAIEICMVLNGDSMTISSVKSS